MTSSRRLNVWVRGPARTRLRTAQAAHPRLLAPRTRSGPPDYVGIGAQRCGTSWWHSLLEQHPSVADLGMGAKELHFFDDPSSGADPAATAQRYAAHFRRRDGQVVGEWTPRYLWDPWAVPALVRAAPEARLLVMLRDPVDRFVSGLGHAAKLGASPGPDTVNAVYSRGLYATQLAPVLELVPPERLLVLQLERCIREPEAQLARTFGFLGLDPAPVDPALGERNRAVVAGTAPPALLESVRAGYRTDAARLADLVPGSVDLALWTSLQGRSAPSTQTDGLT